MSKIVRLPDRTLVVDDDGEPLFPLYGAARKFEDAAIREIAQIYDAGFRKGEISGRDKMRIAIAELLGLPDMVEKRIQAEITASEAFAGNAEIAREQFK